MRPVKNQIIIIILLVSNIFSITAQRNYKFENFGNRSILLNGNVTGSVDDLGATYYNPARLALVEDPVFSINARIYELSSVKLNNITIDGKNLSTSKFNGLPGMVAGSFKLKKLKDHQFAYSFFSRNRSDLSLSYNSQIVDDDIFNENPFINKYLNTTQIKNELRENWYGLSWAKKVSSKFSIGASIFFSTYKYSNGYSQSLNTISESSQVSNYNNSKFIEQKSYGLFTKIGAAWVLEKFELGVNVDLPYLEITGNGKFKYEEFLSGFGSSTGKFTFNDFDDLDATRKYPLGISIGSGIPYKKNKLHLNLSWNANVNAYEKIKIPPLNSETETDLPKFTNNEELNSILNFGFGAEVYLNEKISAFGSFSSDFSPYKEIISTQKSSLSSEDTVNFNTDYFHYGTGVNVASKWANFVAGTIYSRGNSNALKTNLPPIESGSSDDQYSSAKINRWRFVLGVEVLFLKGTKLEKYGLDKKLF